MEEEKRVAILIDADNISYKHLDTIFRDAVKEGVVTYKRYYGNINSAYLNGYKEKMMEYALTGVHCPAYVTGKNSTDSRLIIEAMDFLHEGLVDVFCIVSSDCDFTGLANRLREAGKRVVGMGEEKTPGSFVNACARFKFLDELSGASEEIPKGEESDAARKSTEEREAAPAVPPIENVKSAITSILSDEDEDDERNVDAEGWMLLTRVTSYLQRLFPGFSPKHYGHKRMIKLVEVLGFEIKNATKTIVYIRIGEASQAAPKTAKNKKSGGTAKKSKKTDK